MREQTHAEILADFAARVAAQYRDAEPVEAAEQQREANLDGELEQ